MNLHFTLRDDQALALCGLIDLSVRALGAQLAQGGAAQLKESIRLLADADEIADLIQASLKPEESAPP